MFNFPNKKNRGMGLIEVIIGLAIISTSFLAVVTSYSFFIRVAIRNAETTKANFLVEEGVEVVRFLRDSSWGDFSTLATSTNHYLSFDGGVWMATSSNIYIDDRFERKFVLGDVYRDGAGDIAPLGTFDEGTRKVEIYVSWPIAGATTTLSAETYLSNLHE